MGNCKDCLWWISPEERKPLIDEDYFEATKTKGECDMTKKDNENFEYPASLAFAECEDGGRSWLMTEPDFGCVQWEAVPSDDE